MKSSDKKRNALQHEGTSVENILYYMDWLGIFYIKPDAYAMVKAWEPLENAVK